MSSRIIAAVVGFAALGFASSLAPAPAAPRIEWREEAPGLERAIVEVRGGGEGWRTRIVAVRLDNARFDFRLSARLRGIDAAWSVDRAPATAVIATNAGQFDGIRPWGWVVMGGEEIQPPGHGPLSIAIAWDRAGTVHWMGPHEIEARRAGGRIVEAFQSYPTLLDARGEVPKPLRVPGLGVDVAHRDARLAIGSQADGRLVIAITRFYGLGVLSPPVPLGLTLAEMAGVMRHLGCARAVGLDGGASAQLLLRTNGRKQVWRGWRWVPMGLIAEPRSQ